MEFLLAKKILDLDVNELAALLRYLQTEEPDAFRAIQETINDL
jgi:hypothetical protein